MMGRRTTALAKSRETGLANWQLGISVRGCSRVRGMNIRLNRARLKF